MDNKKPNKSYILHSNLQQYSHEHVFEKGKLEEAIILSSGEKEQIKKELEKAICCIVTKEEHEELHKSNEVGWRRYIEKKKAKVVDLVKKEVLTNEDLETLQKNASLV